MRIKTGANIKKLQDVVDLTVAVLYKYAPRKYTFNDVVSAVDKYMQGSSLSLSRIRYFLLIQDLLDVYKERGFVKLQNGIYETDTTKMPFPFNDGDYDGIEI